MCVCRQSGEKSVMSVKELRPLVAKSGHSKERRSELYFQKTNDESCHTTHFVFCFVFQI